VNIDVLESFTAAVRALRSRVDRELQSHGLRVGQASILRALWAHDGLTPRELSDQLAVEMPTITRTVQRMVRDGLVGREAHPTDARSVRIHLTPRADGLRDAVREVLERETAAALDGFSHDEQRSLIEFLERMHRNARER
jgi:DNA-binding MarR family transcriptional regulator